MKKIAILFLVLLLVVPFALAQQTVKINGNGINNKISIITSGFELSLNEQKEVLDRREKELSENRKQLNEREVEVRKAEASVTRLKLAAQAELDRLKQLQEVTNDARIEFENRKDKLERALSGV